MRIFPPCEEYWTNEPAGFLPSLEDSHYVSGLQSPAPDQIRTEGGEGHEGRHLQQGRPGRRPQPDVDTGRAGEEADEHLLDDDVAGQEHGDHHAHHHQDVGPHWLRSGPHELRVVDTDEQQAGEEGKEATVEDLSYQDDQGTVS